MDQIEEKVEEFKKWYQQQLTYHQKAMGYYCNIIENIDKVDQVLFRVKSCDECIKKFQSKYLPFLDAHSSFKIQDYITDLIGVVITSYSIHYTKLYDFAGQSEALSLKL